MDEVLYWTFLVLNLGSMVVHAVLSRRHYEEVAKIRDIVGPNFRISDLFETVRSPNNPIMFELYGATSHVFTPLGMCVVCRDLGLLHTVEYDPTDYED